MKKLGVLFVTLLTAILAFSFSAFADETAVFSTTELTMNDNGSGSMSTKYFFNKAVYNEPSQDLFNEIIDIFNASTLSKFVSFTKYNTKSDTYIIFDFSFNFDSIDNFNDKTQKIEQLGVASDVLLKSYIQYNNNKSHLSLSQYNLTSLYKTTNWLLFCECPIADNGCEATYYVSFNGADNDYQGFGLEKNNYDAYIDFYVTSSVQPTAAPAATVKPTNTVKPTATAKPVIKTTTKSVAKKDKSPKTGDNTTLILLISLMSVSLIIGVITIRKIKKNVI